MSELPKPDFEKKLAAPITDNFFEAYSKALDGAMNEVEREADKPKR